MTGRSSAEGRQLADEGGTRATTAEMLVEALVERGVAYVFANLGSDHPALIEALADRDRRGRPNPQVIICPHEMNALSAAQAVAMMTGSPQAVWVHTDVGTANLGGSVHNAARTRVPVFICAGMTPYTIDGDLQGKRDSYINHLQDVSDQHGLVRPYVKWSYDIRTGMNVKQVVHRGLQIAGSAPAGPVYVTGAREVLAEKVPSIELSPAQWAPIEPLPMAEAVVREIVHDVAQAENPLIITSYLGRNQDSVDLLVRFAERMGVPVVEVNPVYMNFPANHPLHLGYNADEFISTADLILAIDTDVPWVAARQQPMTGAKVYYVDVDPLKEHLPLWYMPSNRFIQVDSSLALSQLNCVSSEMEREFEQERDRMNVRAIRSRQIHDSQRQAWLADAVPGPDEALTSAVVAATLNTFLDSDSIILNEAITQAEAFYRHLPRTVPGTLYCNGGSSLGWSGGGSVGLKLAAPDRSVVTIVGDGSYFLSVPSATYWMARRYETAFLTVVLNNGGWNATKQNVLRQYPRGTADGSDKYWVSLNKSADLAGIAHAAGGAYARTVTRLSELQAVLPTALAEVDNGRCAVIDVLLAPISEQRD